MKKLVSASLAAVFVIASTPLTGWTSQLPAGTMNLKDLHSGQSEYVEVQLGSHLLEMAARLVEPSEPDIAGIVRGLQHIRVHVLGLTDENRTQVRERLGAIRSELDNDGWERVVTVLQDKEDVCVQLKTRDVEIVEGVMVTILDGDKQAVVVNIAGNIRPDKIGEVVERLNIPELRPFRKAMKKATEPDRE